jgi:hypothetical protein
MENGGYEAMLYDLLKLDISDFDPRVFPRTEALGDQVIMSLDSICKFWFDLLSKAELVEVLSYDYSNPVLDEPFSEGVHRIKKVEWDGEREINKSGFYHSYLEFCRSHQLQIIPDALFWKKIRSLCPGIKDMRKNSGNRARVVVIPCLDQCRDNFICSTKISGFKWENLEQDSRPGE